MAGYVYLIGTPVFGWYKIGKSANAEVRVKDLGILLPFKIDVIAVWKADNHHLLEKSMHEIHKDFRINGEWFEFIKDEVYKVIESVPVEARVFPTGNTKQSFFEHFSNIDADIRRTPSRKVKSGKIIGVKVQKLRGNFTPEEREAKRIASIETQKLKKINKVKQLDLLQ